MTKEIQEILWPNNIRSFANDGADWFLIAKEAGIDIPSGCLTGSCGACEIDVNGETVRPCITNLKVQNGPLKVELTKDPYW